MGFIGEHFLPLVRARQAPPKGADTVAAAAETGISAKHGHVAAVNLMVNYAPAVVRHISGDPPQEAEPACRAFLDWAAARYRAVNLVILTRRDTIAQAISRVLAQRTKVHHVVTDADAAARDRALAALDDPALMVDLMRAASQVVRERAILDRLAVDYADTALALTYEDLVDDTANTAARLVAHARRAGLDPPGKTVRRGLQKVVPAEVDTRLRADFRQFLDREIVRFL